MRFVILFALFFLSFQFNPQCLITTPNQCSTQNGTFINFFDTCSNSTCIANLLTPTLFCTINYSNGTCMAYLGYNNSYYQAIGLAIGSDNEFIPSPQDRGQPSCSSCSSMNPTYYQPGTYLNVFSVQWNCSSLIWHLDNSNLTISDGITPVQTTCTGACCTSQSKVKYIL